MTSLIGGLARDSAGYFSYRLAPCKKRIEMRYEYERVDMKNNVVYQARVMDEIHRKLIDEHAQKGHRFAGYVPTVSGANGKILAFDLVFEVNG